MMLQAKGWPVFALYGVLALCGTALVWHGDLSMREVMLFLTGAMGVPAGYGLKASADAGKVDS